MTPLRHTGDTRDEAQRFNASQARTEAAALAGELGIDSQLLAMSEAYMELRSQGRFEEARAMKLRAVALKAAAAAYREGK